MEENAKTLIHEHNKKIDAIELAKAEENKRKEKEEEL